MVSLARPVFVPIPVIVNMSIAVIVLMSVSVVMFVRMSVVVTMSILMIVPVNIPQVIFALGLVIVVVPVPMDMLLSVPTAIPVKISQVIFALRFEILAVNVFGTFSLIRLTIRRQFMALSESQLRRQLDNKPPVAVTNKKMNRLINDFFNLILLERNAPEFLPRPDGL